MNNELKKSLLALIIFRLLLVSLVMGVGLLALPQQLSFFQFIQPFTLAVYVLSVFYILLWKYTQLPNLLYYTQFLFDLILISTLIFVSGGINSLFTPFYVLIIVYASLLKDRDAVIIAVTLSITSYSGIVHLGYLGWVPGASSIGPYPLLIYRISLNTLGFLAVALLGIYLSERIRSARQELGAVKVVHQNIVNSLRDGLLTLDAEGVITSLNRAAEEISGYSEEDLLSTKISDLFSESVSNRILESDFELSPRALHMECWTENKTGYPLFLVLSCSPLLSHQRERIGYILAFQDLTEIKKREDELQFKEKMAAIGQMAAGLAHEIRNPLGSLSGSIQVLQSELQLSDKKARLIEIALRECDRLNKIVGDFLAYAGSRPSRIQPTDLLSLVHDTIELFKNSPDFQGDYAIEISSSANPLVGQADSDQFKQVVWNILQNGIRSMPGGGKLSIELCTNDSKVLMKFTDQGVGLSSAEKTKLFQPFHSGFGKGAGLGMSIVYQIVQQHRGSIDIESYPGSGTTVSISLPV